MPSDSMLLSFQNTPYYTTPTILWLHQSHQPNNTTIFSGILLFLMVSLLFPYGLNSMVNRQMTPLIPLLLSLVTVYTQITILAASNSLPITDLIWKKNNYIKYHFTFVTAFLKYSLTACQQSCYIFVVHWLSSLGDYFTPFPLPWTFSHLFYHLHDPILLRILILSEGNVYSLPASVPIFPDSCLLV